MVLVRCEDFLADLDEPEEIAIAEGPGGLP
jgi:hypothetical protein